MQACVPYHSVASAVSPLLTLLVNYGCNVDWYIRHAHRLLLTVASISKKLNAGFPDAYTSTNKKQLKNCTFTESTQVWPHFEQHSRGDTEIWHMSSCNHRWKALLKVLCKANNSPEDKAIEEDEGQELDNEVYQPAGPLLTEADEPIAVPHSLLLLLRLSIC